MRREEQLEGVTGEARSRRRAGTSRNGISTLFITFFLFMARSYPEVI